MADSVNETKEKAKEEAALEEHDEGLVDTVQAKLDDLLGGSSDDADDVDDTDDDQQAEDDKVDDDSTPEDGDDSGNEDDNKQADEDDDDDNSTPEDGEKKDEPESEEEVTLPDAHYRAAVHQGWTPDEIKDYFEASPETAMKTFAKIHETTNKLSSEFARIGRMKSTSEQKIVPKADDEAGNDTAEIAALKEQYGEDSAVVKAFTTMQTKLDAAVIQPEATNKREDTGELDPTIRSTVDKFFVDPALKPYADFYGEGKDAAKLTHEQSGNRNKMLEMADNIILGRWSQGLDTTLEGVLESAHLLVSEPAREEALRKELTAKVIKRAKGVSLRPAKSKTVPPAKDATLSEKDFEEKTRVNLKKTFGT